MKRFDLMNFIFCLIEVKLMKQIIIIYYIYIINSTVFTCYQSNMISKKILIINKCRMRSVLLLLLLLHNYYATVPNFLFVLFYIIYYYFLEWKKFQVFLYTDSVFLGYIGQVHFLQNMLCFYYHWTILTIKIYVLN